MFTHVSAGGNYPISTPGGDWRSLVMEMVLTAILVSVILNTATGGRSIGHNAAIAVGATVTLLGPVRQPDQRRLDEPGPHPGPDIAGNDYTGWWICILGPVIGTVIARRSSQRSAGCPRRRSGRPPRAAPCPCKTAPPQEQEAGQRARVRGGTHRDTPRRLSLVVPGTRSDCPPPIDSRTPCRAPPCTAGTLPRPTRPNRSAGTCELASRCPQRPAGASRPAGLCIVSG
jgi:Major intrinsic protein